jgi:hypothetical protein
MKICPSCRYHNREGYMFCEDCGEEITQVESLPDALPGIPLEPGLTLLVEGSDTGIRLELDHRLVLGRCDPDREQQPDIDLNAYDAFDKGVSVIHAQIEHDRDGIKIMDVGSKNGTFVNGRQLVPQRAYVLRDGDELRFSRLVATVRLVES